MNERKNSLINRADKLEKIVVERSMRYETIIPNEPIKQVIYVLHGYGQLVSFFKRKFSSFQLPNTLFVFPEGMHRFYLQGSSGRVGASWMTKEWRENDIIENNHALSTLQNHIQQLYNPEKTIVLGFSQGGATAARWVTSTNIKCDHFIAWGSVFPPDLSETDEPINALIKTAVFGNNDPYFPAEVLTKVQADYNLQNFKCVIFDGAHDIDIKTLSTILA